MKILTGALTDNQIFTNMTDGPYVTVIRTRRGSFSVKPYLITVFINKWT